VQLVDVVAGRGDVGVGAGGDRLSVDRCADVGPQQLAGAELLDPRLD
jgi:hypothetical protein